jgi:uncharacterized membrane protein
MDSPAPRLRSLDTLRGAVMVLMALDHVRDFFHRGAMSFSPTDLARTTPALFFTRWITHFCAPVFMFASGMGAFLWLQRRRDKAALTRFLWTRGLWLIVLELTVMRVSYYFNFDPKLPVLLVVLWALGASMIALAVLCRLPLPALAGISVATIALHNLFDGIKPAQFGGAAWIWNVLHQPGAFPVGPTLVLVAYPLVPWIAVMAAGFCFGAVMLRPAAERQRILLRTGSALALAFLVIRAINVYGDPSRWSVQSSAVFTLLSFLRCTKYPPSLDYLLMTLGPALLCFAWFDRRDWKAANPLIVFGRVPLFYFVIHFYAIHALAKAMAWVRYGRPAYLFQPLPNMGGPRKLFPPDFGYDLWVVYVVWVLIVIAMYPLCRWFAALKARRKDWWLSYL